MQFILEFLSLIASSGSRVQLPANPDTEAEVMASDSKVVGTQEGDLDCLPRLELYATPFLHRSRCGHLEDAWSAHLLALPKKI